MFFLTLILGIVLQVLGYMLAPKPKRDKPPPAQDLEGPTAEAGRPIPRIVGTLTITGVNVIGSMDKSVITQDIKV